MTDTNDTKMMGEILGSDFVKEIIKDLQIGEEKPEVQAELITMIGQVMMERLILETYKALPRELHTKADEFFESGDIVGARKFLTQHIPDFDAMVRREASLEYEKIKTNAHMIRQGVEPAAE